MPTGLGLRPGAKAPDEPPYPTGYAPPLDSTQQPRVGQSPSASAICPPQPAALASFRIRTRSTRHQAEAPEPCRTAGPITIDNPGPRTRARPRRHRPRSLRRRTLAARNGSPAHALSSVSGRLRRSAGRGGFSVVGEQRAKFGPRGPHGPPETAVRVDLPPWRAAFPASYAAISTCRRLTFNARHTRSHSQRTFASPRKLKRRKPSACLIQP